MVLTPCADVSAADWLGQGAQPWQRMVGFGPAGFPAYARLRFLPDPTHPGQHESDAARDADAPTETEQLRLVLGTLAGHTRTPDECHFCLWDGWGTDIEGDDGRRAAAGHGRRIAPAFPREVLAGPKVVVVPHRAYYLFRGRLADFGDWGAAELWPGQPRTHMPDPSFVWPADRAWCVANDVDPHWAGIGATRPAVDQLLADSRLDVVRADPRVDPPHYR